MAMNAWKRVIHSLLPGTRSETAFGLAIHSSCGASASRQQERRLQTNQAQAGRLRNRHHRSIDEHVVKIHGAVRPKAEWVCG